MSNQKTPNNSKRHRRRRDESASRSMFVEVYEEKENQNKKFTDRFIKSQQEEIPEPEIKGRRGINLFKGKKDKSLKSDTKSIQFFDSYDKHDSEKRIRRNKRNAKTLLFLGGSALVIVAVIVGSVLLFDGKGKDEETLFAENESNVNNVVIYYDDSSIEVETLAETVGEVLSENEIKLVNNQSTNFTEEDTVYDGMEIFISSPMTVSIIQKGITNSVIVYGGRVADVFAEMEVELDDYDIIDPSAETLVYDGMQIEFVNVEYKEIYVTEDLPYETEEGETDTVEAGYYHEEQEGTEGKVQITYRVKYVDDVELSREEVDREIVEESINRIILWGTAAKSNNDSGSDSGDYDDVDVTNPGEQETNPSVPAAPSDYIEIMSGHVTAYTHTGNTTATGTWPRSTRTLDNPGSCAVVPGTIPYGSLLYVTGYGYCIAEDTGAFRHDPDRWNQIDLFMNTRDECIIWGRRDDVKVYILRKGY